jgi:hypothetical protein
MTDILCSECGWHARYDCDNARLCTCPWCGTDQLTYPEIAIEIDPEPIPLPGPPIEVTPEIETPPA